MIDPLLIGALIEQFGLGGALGISIFLLLLAFEALRIRKVGMAVGGFVSAAIVYTVVIFVALALGTVLGWWDINPGAIQEDAGRAVSAVVSWAMDEGVRLFNRVMGRV